MPIAAIDQSFVFKATLPQLPDPQDVPPSDPLAALVGTWVGRGFNAIWVPRWPGSGHFLLLTLTDEALSFSRIPGIVPNRGFLQDDIGMTGLTYMQQISDPDGNGLHIEPGIWLTAPQTTAPNIPPTVVRMASIPHGTTVVLQGPASPPSDGPPPLGQLPVDLRPMPINLGPPVSAGAPIDMPELDLSQTPQTRTSPLPPEISQPVLSNPNSLLQVQNDALTTQGYTISATTTLEVTSTDVPVIGGGTDNTAFLSGPNPNNEEGNASANVVSATVWIETVTPPAGEAGFTQLQYSQTVMLDFGDQRWPHVTVATLRQTSLGPQPVMPQPPAVVLPGD
jgi:hypothetical protein